MDLFFKGKKKSGGVKEKEDNTISSKNSGSSTSGFNINFDSFPSTNSFRTATATSTSTSTAHNKSVMAMSDKFSIGIEQVVVSFTLLVVSIYLLSTTSSRYTLSQFLNYFFSSSKSKSRQDDSNHENIENDNHKTLTPCQHSNSQSNSNTFALSHESPSNNSNTSKSIQSKLASYMKSKSKPLTTTKTSTTTKSTSAIPQSNVSYSSPPRISKTNPILRKSKSVPHSPSLLLQNTISATLHNDEDSHIRSTSNPNQCLQQTDLHAQNVNLNHSHNTTHNNTNTYHNPTHQFEREYYATIRNATYATLVLPPRCRLHTYTSTNTDTSSSQNQNHTTMTDKLANTVTSIDSITNILTTIISILHRILTYHYLSAIQYFTYRVGRALKYRFYKEILGILIRDNEDNDDDDDDEDDDDAAEESTQSNTKTININIHKKKNINTNTNIIPMNTSTNVPIYTLPNVRERFFTTDGNDDDDDSITSFTGTVDIDSKAIMNISIPNIASSSSPFSKNKSKHEALHSTTTASTSMTTSTASTDTQYVNTTSTDSTQSTTSIASPFSSQLFPFVSDLSKRNLQVHSNLQNNASNKIKSHSSKVRHEQRKQPIASSIHSTRKKDALEHYRNNNTSPFSTAPNSTTTTTINTPTSDFHSPMNINMNKKEPTSFTPSTTFISDSTFRTSNTTSQTSINPNNEFCDPQHASFYDNFPHYYSQNMGNEKKKKTKLNYFDAASNKATLIKIQREAPMPDKRGYVLGDELLENSSDTPLLAFVNSRSGAQQGLFLRAQLGRLLNPIQVWDLANGGPEDILLSFSKAFTRLRLLVCGGDGTVSWIISALDKLKLDKWPPIAILPLGTGNDLARVHGWGGGYANESLLLLLNQIQESYVSLLDRWEMSIRPLTRSSRSSSKSSSKSKIVRKPFTNYMSIGVDALSALQVHNLRENSPTLFFSRAINKVWYALFGAEDAIKASCSGLCEQVELVADGVRVPIPTDSQGIIFLNIDSYLGGVSLWSNGVPFFPNTRMKKRKKMERRYSDGDCSVSSSSGLQSVGLGLGVGIGGTGVQGQRKRIGSFDESMNGDEIDVMENSNYSSHNDVSLSSQEDRFFAMTRCDVPSSCQDGKLDVISFRGNFHLGQIRVGIGQADLLCQCKKASIVLKKGTAVQIDGEPWKQNKCQMTIERKKDPAIMLHKALEEGGGMETEMANLLDWAEEKNIINQEIHTALMKEFSKRIESKTRNRRERSQDNLIFMMKRALASGNALSSMY